MEYRYQRIALHELMIPDNQKILEIKGLTAQDVYDLLQNELPTTAVIVSNLRLNPIAGCIVDNGKLLTHQDKEYVRYNIEIPEDDSLEMRKAIDEQFLETALAFADLLRESVRENNITEDIPWNDGMLIMQYVTGLDKTELSDGDFVQLVEKFKLDKDLSKNEFIKKLFRSTFTMRLIGQIYHDLMHLLMLESVGDDPAYTLLYDQLEILAGCEWEYQQHYLLEDHFKEEFATLHLENRIYSRSLYLDVFTRISQAIFENENQVLLPADTLKEEVYDYKATISYQESMESLEVLTQGFIEKTKEVVSALQSFSSNHIGICMLSLLDKFGITEKYARSMIVMFTRQNITLSHEIFVRFLTYIIEHSVLSEPRYKKIYTELFQGYLPLPGLVFENTEQGKKLMKTCHQIVQHFPIPKDYLLEQKIAWGLSPYANI